MGREAVYAGKGTSGMGRSGATRNSAARGTGASFGRRAKCLRPTPCGRRGRRAGRTGAASLDYVLILGVILPMVAFILRVGPRMIRLAYEMVSVLVSWPFM